MHRKKILGIPYAAWSETFIIVAGLWAINAFFGDGHRWVGMLLHPFWIAVLLISSQYGTSAGFMCVAACTAALYVGNVPQERLNETFFDYQFRLSFLPGLWFLTAFCLGEIRLRLESKNETLETNFTHMKRESERILTAYERLKAAKEYQELVIASQQHSAAALYQAFQYLISVNPAHIIRDLDKIVVTALDPKKFSVYALGQNGFEAATCYGWDDGDHYLVRITPDQPLFREVAEQKRLVCVVSQLDKEILSGQGLMAAPLIDKESGQVFGLIKIEAVNFLEFNLSTIQIFKTLCELIGMAYSHARDSKTLARHSMAGRYPEVYSNAFYRFQHSFLQQLSAVLQLPFSQIVFIAEAEDVDEQLVVRTLTAQLPKMALICESGASLQFLILLPGMRGADAEVLSEKLLESIRAQPDLKKVRCVQQVESSDRRTAPELERKPS